MVRSFPRASAGFSRLAASPVPAAPPAPISIWISSINKTMGIGLDSTSSITDLSRASNSPLTLAPALSKPMSNKISCTPFRFGGTSPAAKRNANASTSAVLPTPASPVRIGLFWRRRIKISIICLISASLPVTGSISPFRAFSVKLLPYLAKALSALLLPAVVRSDGICFAISAFSSELVVIVKISSANVSGFSFKNSGDILAKIFCRFFSFSRV